jgi:malonyl-CoA O-methyltransferase
LQKKDDSIPACPDVDWVCSANRAQYDVIWYRPGKREPADRAIRSLEKIQNKSGGFVGSYGKDSDYIPNAETSRAVKYFLDAWRLKLQGEQPGA